ncbi:diguanylate cyclase domain-containing protein, partial [Salmonella enterica]|uniref:diguanylate cyclase domain-containing protein n=2 Tax=Gammaproteobacteria TaxID=1236 RepID=UPI003F1B4414
DQLLRDVGLRLREDLRSQDTLARIGGDEFVLLVQLTQPDDAMGLAERQVGLIHRAFKIAEHELKISASIGIALFPGNGSTPEEL